MPPWLFPTVAGLGLLTFIVGAFLVLRGAPSRRNKAVVLVGGVVFLVPCLFVLAGGLLVPFFGKG